MYSLEYLQELKALHQDKKRPKGFGGKVKDLGEFYKWIQYWQPSDCLDYGCGKGVILAHLKEEFPHIEFQGYDPALQMWERRPDKKYKMIFCNDVLEHVEPKFISHVLQDINNLTKEYVWLRIDTLPARKKLSDGRNAHLIIENKQWWLNLIQEQINGNIVYSELNKKGKLDIAIEK